MQAVLRDVLEKFLPDDVHTRSNGRVRGKYFFFLFRLLFLIAFFFFFYWEREREIRENFIEREKQKLEYKRGEKKITTTSHHQGGEGKQKKGSKDSQSTQDYNSSLY